MKKYKVNPLTLLYVNMLFPFVLMFTSSLTAIIICFLISSGFLLFFNEKKRLLKFSIIFLIFLLIFQFQDYLDSGKFKMFFELINYIALKIIPVLMIASILFYNIQTSELLSALNNLKLPKNLIIGITVAFRFFPTFGHEFKFIKQTMKMRNISMSILKPFKSLKYFLVPMLFRCSLLADELTSAGLTKGIECDVKRSSIYDVKIKKFDIFIMILSTIVTIGVLI